MPQEEILDGKEKEIVQVGVVVKDLEKTVEYLTSLGLGPFSIRTVTHPSATVHGEKAFYEVRLAKSQQGPVELELIDRERRMIERRIKAARFPAVKTPIHMRMSMPGFRFSGNSVVSETGWSPSGSISRRITKMNPG